MINENIKQIILAPDSFKESMTSKEACIAMEKGVKKVFNNAKCIYVPMADGGEGTMYSLVSSTDGKIYNTEVTSPLGEKIIAKYGILGDDKTAVIEVAEACGIHLVEKFKRNPLLTTTYGVGELIKKVLDKNIKKIIIGLGGSVTNDAGIGMLQALGMSFKDSNNCEIGFGGGEINKIKFIDLKNFDKRILNIEIEVACDVKNYLTGKNGASYVFAPQKGANKHMVEILDNNLKYYSNFVREKFNIEIDNIEGAGAAGGLGSALMSFCNAKLKNGIDIVIKYSDLENKIKMADIVFTGEGSIDFQTKFGKTPVGVSMLAKKYNVPVIAFAGKVGKNVDELYDLGINSIISIMNETLDLDEALKMGKDNLEIAVENVCRVLNIRNRYSLDFRLAINIDKTDINNIINNNFNYLNNSYFIDICDNEDFIDNYKGKDKFLYYKTYVYFTYKYKNYTDEFFSEQIIVINNIIKFLLNRNYQFEVISEFEHMLFNK